MENPAPAPRDVDVLEASDSPSDTGAGTGPNSPKQFKFFKSKSKDYFNLDIHTTFTIQPGQQKSKMCPPRRTNYGGLTHSTSESAILQDKSNSNRKRRNDDETNMSIKTNIGTGPFALANKINIKKRWSSDMASFCIQTGLGPLAPSPKKPKYPRMQGQRQTTIDEFLFSSTDPEKPKEVSPSNQLQSGQVMLKEAKDPSLGDPYYYLPNLETFPPSYFNIQRKKIIESPQPDNYFAILPDEMVLKVFKWLPKLALANAALSCKRFAGLARDDVLWKRIDANGQILTENSLLIILSRKPIYLRLARSSIPGPINLPEGCMASQLLYLDLTMSVIPPDVVSQILGICPSLTKLSLEHLELEDNVFDIMDQFSSSIVTLNITMCYNVNAKGLAGFLKNASKLTSLNMGCIKQKDWSHEDLLLVVKSLPASIERLNISGFRELMKDDHVAIITKRLKNLVDLDLSDSNEITQLSVELCLENLESAQHLSFSRCYAIEPHAYLLLAQLTNLQYLELFSLFKEPAIEAITKALKNIQINRFPFSSIARPTVGNRRGSIWGERFINRTSRASIMDQILKIVGSSEFPQFQSKVKLEGQTFAIATQEIDPESLYDYLYPTVKRSPETNPFDKLSDKAILNIFKWLNQSALGQCARTCRRFNALVNVEDNWKRIDAPGLILTNIAVETIFQRQPVYLRLASSYIPPPISLPINFIASKLLYLDLTMSTIEPSNLTTILGLCASLQKLSLEHLELEDSTFNAMQIFSGSINTLNLAMCSNVNPKGIAQFLRRAKKLEQLNMAWLENSDWTQHDLLALFNFFPCSIEQLNISGLRNLLTDRHVEVIVKRLPHLIDLDLSDSTTITAITVRLIVKYLVYIQHLSFSRCYNIELQAYVLLESCQCLRYLELFSLLKTSTLEALEQALNGIQINTFPFSAISRPTIGHRRSSIWGQRLNK